MKKLLTVALCSLFCLGIITCKSGFPAERIFAENASKYEKLDSELVKLLTFYYKENNQEPKDKNIIAFFRMDELKGEGDDPMVINPMVIRGKEGKACLDISRFVKFHDSGVYRFKVYQRGYSADGGLIIPDSQTLENRYVEYDKSEFEIRIVIVEDSNEACGLRLDSEQSGIRYMHSKEKVDRVLFNNKVGKKISVTETIDTGKKLLKGGEKNKFRITIKNTGPYVVKNIYVRKYLQEYTNFVKGDKYFKNKSLNSVNRIMGGYGCIEDREHATWLIGEIHPGESIVCEHTFRVHTCKPERVYVDNKVLYEIISEHESRDFYINQSKDPMQMSRIEVPEIEIK